MKIARHLAAAISVVMLTASTAASAGPQDAKLTMPSPPFTAAPMPVQTFSWGAVNPLTIGSGSGGAGAGKVVFQDMSVTRATDVQSLQFLTALSTGAHFDTVVLTSGPITLTLKTVFVTGYKSELGDGDKGPIDTITMAYGSVGYSIGGTCVGVC